MAKSRGKTPRQPTSRRRRRDEDTRDEDDSLSFEDERELDRLFEQAMVDEELAAADVIPGPGGGGRDPKKERELRKAVKAAKRTPAQSRAALRRKTRIFYDLQRLRIQTAGRTYKRAVDIELHELDLAVLENRAEELHQAERNALGDIRLHLSTMPAYNKVLADRERYKGIGPTLAAVILSEVDITRCDTVSALWRYAGLSVVPSGRCNACFDPVSPTERRDEDGEILYSHDFNRSKKCPLGQYIPGDDVLESAKAERGIKGKKLPFNRFFKTKMVGVMAGCLLKSGSPFRKYYDDYKHRLTVKKWGRNDGHRHQAAMRYMTKMVLQDIWHNWRQLEGYPVRESYATEYLGKIHAA
jgi:Transposase IS116/IS110/IS902 family